MQQSLSIDNDLLELYSVNEQNLKQSRDSKTYSGINKQSQDKVTIRKCNLTNEEYLLYTKIKDANKENLIKIQTIFQRGNVCTIIMERIDDDFYSYMTTSDEYKNLKYEQKKIIFSQMVAAIEQLHDLNIIHRNLKPESFCLVTNNGEKKIKLYQFNLNKPNNFWMPQYMSPEIICYNQYDKTVDFWALGCILFELLTGKPFFQGTQDQIKSKIQKIEQAEINKMIADGLKDFSQDVDIVYELLQRNPKNRKTARISNQQQCMKVVFLRQNFPQTVFNQADDVKKKQTFQFNKSLAKNLIDKIKKQIQGYNEYFKKQINENNTQIQAEQINQFIMLQLQNNQQQLESIQKDQIILENSIHLFQLSQIQNLYKNYNKANKEYEDQFKQNQKQILNLKEIETKKEQQLQENLKNLNNQYFSEKEQMEKLTQQFGIELQKTEDITQKLADSELINRVRDIQKQSQQIFKQRDQFNEQQDIQTLIQEFQFRNQQIQDLKTQLNQIFTDSEIKQQQLITEAQKKFNNEYQRYIFKLEYFKNLQNIQIAKYIEELQQQLICYQQYLDTHNQCFKIDQVIDIQKSEQTQKQLDQELQNLQKIESYINNYLSEYKKKQDLYNKKAQLQIQNQNLLITQRSSIKNQLGQLQSFLNQNDQYQLQIKIIQNELINYQQALDVLEKDFYQLIMQQQIQLELDTEQNLQNQVQEHQNLLTQLQELDKQINQCCNHFLQLERENQILLQWKQIRENLESLKQQMKNFDFNINFETYQSAMQIIQSKFKTSQNYFKQCNQYFSDNQKVFQELKNKFEQKNDEFDNLSQILPEELQNLYQISLESKSQLDIIYNLFSQQMQRVQFQENQYEEQKASQFWQNISDLNKQIQKLDQEINPLQKDKYDSSLVQNYQNNIQQCMKQIDSIQQQINQIDKNQVEIYKNNIQSIPSQIYLLIIFKSYQNLRILEADKNKNEETIKSIKLLDIRFQYYKSELEQSKISHQNILKLIEEEEELQMNYENYQKKKRQRIEVRLKGKLSNQKAIQNILKLLPYKDFCQILIVQMIESELDQKLMY